MITNPSRIFLGQILMAMVFSTSSIIIARAQSPHMGSGYIPNRVYISGDKRFGDFEEMLAEIARADVAFVGEQHNDPATHRMERAILEGLARRRGDIVVAMEMFERDTQSALDAYLVGHISEEDFLNVSRPWPNYETDYRPLVEFARLHGWRVVASNAPRPIALQVSRQGLDAARNGSENERKLVAADFSCPMDDYFKRFAEAMGQGHPHSSEEAHQQQEDQKQIDDKKQEDEQKAAIERFYYAQCVKDETMAESIANSLTPKTGDESGSQNKHMVVHFNGAFHSDYHLGTASRVIRRLPKSSVKVISVIPVENLDAINPEEYSKRADYIIFTLAPQ